MQSVERLKFQLHLLAALICVLALGCIPEVSETIERARNESVQPSQGSPATDEDTQPSPDPRTAQKPVTRGTDVDTPDSAADPAQRHKVGDDNYEPADHFNKRFASWYGVRANYDLVYKDVLAFYPDGRYNGCVAFLSAALRRMGVNVPIRTTSTESPSLVTKPFSLYLEQSLGWMRINNAQQLQTGDVVFTQDNPSYPGYPAHTYMFHSWSDRGTGLALVIDNQDFKHERNIYSSGGGYNFTPFAYALRAL